MTSQQHHSIIPQQFEYVEEFMLFAKLLERFPADIPHRIACVKKAIDQVKSEHKPYLSFKDPFFADIIMLNVIAENLSLTNPDLFHVEGHALPPSASAVSNNFKKSNDSLLPQMHAAQHLLPFTKTCLHCTALLANPQFANLVCVYTDTKGPQVFARYTVRFCF